MNPPQYIYYLTLAFTLILGYLLKKPCIDLPWGGPEFIEYSKICYSDIIPLYQLRGLETKLFPYVQFRSLEYPPFIGLQMWLTALVSRNYIQFFYANIFINTLLAFLSAWALLAAAPDRRRVFIFCAGTPVLFYAFYNWDLTSVSAICLAILAWSRQRVFLTGLAIGIGVSGKLYPIFAIPSLAVAILGGMPRQSLANVWKPVATLLVGLLCGLALLNAPIMLGDYLVNGNIKGWTAIFTFHAARTPDYGSFVYWLMRILGFDPTNFSYKAMIDGWSSGLLMLGTAFVLVLQYRRKFDTWQSTTAILALCLILAKVHSPQFTIWMVPLLVVTRVPMILIVFYFIADAATLTTLLQWLGNMSSHSLKNAVMASIILKNLALIWIFLWCAVAKPAGSMVTDSRLSA